MDVEEKKHDVTVPSSRPYAVEDVMGDLLLLAARRLKMGGRLVYLFPADDTWTVAHLPQHACLKLVAVATQLLTKSNGFNRKCIVMEKHIEYEPSRPDHRTSTWLHGGGGTDVTSAFTALREKVFRPRTEEAAERRDRCAAEKQAEKKAHMERRAAKLAQAKGQQQQHAQQQELQQPQPPPGPV
jgi:hypothetical protein